MINSYYYHVYRSIKKYQEPQPNFCLDIINPLHLLYIYYYHYINIYKRTFSSLSNPIMNPETIPTSNEVIKESAPIETHHEANHNSEFGTIKEFNELNSKGSFNFSPSKVFCVCLEKCDAKECIADQKSDETTEEITLLKTIMDRKDNEFDQKMILQTIKTNVPKIILDDCELPPWHKLVAYVCKDIDFEEYSRNERFEFSKKKLEENKKN